MLYHKNHSSFLFILLVIIVISLLTSCSGGNSDNASQTSTTSATPATTRTGTIDVGETVALTTQQAGTDGTVITVQKPGDPLDGLEIMVPPQAYTDSKEFRISAAPITKHTFGDDFIAASPMITIDNGGGYSDQLISVKVPVKIPDGYFAMGFMYDSITRQLEGMPLLETDADSITVGTRHFADFLIGMINQVKIKDDVNSGFQPGIDDWQFTNRGSYITNGHCEGQSMSAMWYYYTKPDGTNAHLYNLYDNNGKKPATPDLWQDDSFGYRLCSVIQKDIDTGSYAYEFWPGIAGRAWKFVNNEWQWVTVPKLISDKTTRDLFAFAMQMTGEPQQVGMQSDAGGGHSMICYKVSKDTLYVADPNYPGITDRKIELINDTFKPYDSGDNKDDMDNGNTKNYEHIYYKAKSTIADWTKIAQRWTEFKNGTIGDDKFPAYQIVYKDEEGHFQELTEGMTFAVNKVIFGVDSSGTGVYIYRDGVALQWDASGKFELNPGNNLLGICIIKQVGTSTKYKYVDFKYLNVVYEPKETTQPVTTTASSTMPSTTSTATAAGGGWYLDGEPVIEKENAVNDEYHTYSLTATNGSASGVYTWSDGECGGTYTGSMTWTPPPAYMQPGSVINFSMTSNTAVQNTCGSRSVGSGGWIKAEGTTIVKALDETSPSASGTYTVPDGRAGQKLQMWATIGVANLHVTVYYNYVYQSTGTTAR